MEPGAGGGVDCAHLAAQPRILQRSKCAAQRSCCAAAASVLRFGLPTGYRLWIFDSIRSPLDPLRSRGGWAAQLALQLLQLSHYRGHLRPRRAALFHTGAGTCGAPAGTFAVNFGRAAATAAGPHWGHGFAPSNGTKIIRCARKSKCSAFHAHFAALWVLNAQART